MATTLTTAERTLWTTRLASAEDALHKLMIGESARVYVDQNGERIEYTAANAQRLRAYIAEIKDLLGLKTISGPLTPWFGH